MCQGDLDDKEELCVSKAYEQAGVNIEAGYEAVKRMKSHVERTNRLGVMERSVALAVCLTCQN